MYRAEINSFAVEKLFSQEAQKSERMQIYYRQMNQTRLKLINEIQQTQEQLRMKKPLFKEKKKSAKSADNTKTTTTRTTKITAWATINAWTAESKFSKRSRISWSN